MRRFVAIALCLVALTVWVAVMFIEHRNRIASALYLAGCETSPLEETTLPGIGHFSVMHIACEHGEKEEYIDVYASNASNNVSPWWADHGTLIFRYDPKNSQIPTITISGKTQIVIAVPTVSSVAVEVEKWNGMDIRYKIGHFDYP